MIRFASYIALAALLHGCSLGPEFLRDEHTPEAPEAFINADALEGDAASMAKWWERIDDPLLSDYVTQLLSDNLSLQQAGERLIQATQNVRSARADYYPTLGIDSRAGRSFSPGVRNSNIPFDIPRGRNYENNYNADLTTSWGLDVFGRVSRNVEAGIANAEATALDNEALTHSLIAELAKRRVAVAVNARLVAWSQANTKSRETSYALVERRYNLGVQSTALSDVYLAEENLTSVAADIHGFERALAAESYQLDVLLGKAPGSTNAVKADFPLLPAPRDVPLCLPADLLDRRPDIRAAELRTKAANAQIGLAIADLYPDISLGGALGVTGNRTTDLFSTEQLAGNMFSTITMRLLEGGALRANIRIQESEMRELAGAYAETILNAMREVETALQAEQAITKELAQLARSVDALQKAEALAETRYTQGIIPLREFLETQQRRYAVEQNWLRTQQLAWDTRIDLYLALGGDWFNADTDNAQCSTLTPPEKEAPNAT